MNPKNILPLHGPEVKCYIFLNQKLKKYILKFEPIMFALRKLEAIGSYHCHYSGVLLIGWEALNGTTSRGLFDEILWPPVEDHLASNDFPEQYTFLRS